MEETSPKTCLISMTKCFSSRMRKQKKNRNISREIARGVLTICAPLALCAPASGADPGTDTVPAAATEIDELTVSSRRAPGKLNAPTLTQSISGNQMAKLGIRNMADAVRRFAGTNVKDYGGTGGLKTVSVRNMGAAHTGVSYDGIPVSNCQAGQIDIGRFSLDNVGMLTLATGHIDDMLQPARLYSSAAVLGIQTERPHFERGRRWGMRAKVSGGSFGYVSPSVRWWQRVSEKRRHRSTPPSCTRTATTPSHLSTANTAPERSATIQRSTRGTQKETYTAKCRTAATCE